jgi:hypothetical protein
MFICVTPRWFSGWPHGTTLRRLHYVPLIHAAQGYDAGVPVPTMGLRLDVRGCQARPNSWLMHIENLGGNITTTHKDKVTGSN